MDMQVAGVDDLNQLRGYMERLKDETGKKASGILVDGGALKISDAVIAEAKNDPIVEIVSYSLKVDCRPSF